MSGQCHNLCSKKPKQLKMYLEAQQGPNGPRGVPIYLCAKCARELGHAGK